MPQTLRDGESSHPRFTTGPCNRRRPQPPPLLRLRRAFQTLLPWLTPATGVALSTPTLSIATAPRLRITTSTRITGRARCTTDARHVRWWMGLRISLEWHRRLEQRRCVAGRSGIRRLCSGSTTATFYSAWIEWYPYSETRVYGVNPGDDMFVETVDAGCRGRLRICRGCNPGYL